MREEDERKNKDSVCHSLLQFFFLYFTHGILCKLNKRT